MNQVLLGISFCLLPRRMYYYAALDVRTTYCTDRAAVTTRSANTLIPSYYSSPLPWSYLLSLAPGYYSTCILSSLFRGNQQRSQGAAISRRTNHSPQMERRHGCLANHPDDPISTSIIIFRSKGHDYSVETIERVIIRGIWALTGCNDT